MKKTIFVLIGLIILGGIVFNVYFSDDGIPINPNAKLPTGYVVAQPAIDITYDNIEEHLSNNAIIRDLPDNLGILFKFYNFDKEYREIEKTYVLSNDGVEEGNLNNPELTLFLNSKYMKDWNSRNFCRIMSNAINNGDFGYETSLSSISLGWKLKKLTKHKSCFGL